MFRVLLRAGRPRPGIPIALIGAASWLADGPQLDRLRLRRVVLASGEGDWEDIGESWRMAAALGAKAIPNRADNWGPQWAHDWATWHRMLPQHRRGLTCPAPSRQHVGCRHEGHVRGG